MKGHSYSFLLRCGLVWFQWKEVGIIAFVLKPYFHFLVIQADFKQQTWELGRQHGLVGNVFDERPEDLGLLSGTHV